jgi:hypothetical protein
VGEPSIATGYFWILFFLILFRTRGVVSQAVFLLMCWLGFHLHERAFLLTPILLLACAFRARSARHWRDSLFIATSAALIVCVFTYEVSWIITPLHPADKAAILGALRELSFAYADGRINLPLLTGITALVALLLVTVVHMTRPYTLAKKSSQAIAIVFVLLAGLASAIAILVDCTFAPSALAMATYQPVFVSLAIAGAGLFLLWHGAHEVRWFQPAILIIIVALSPRMYRMWSPPGTGATISATSNPG